MEAWRRELYANTLYHHGVLGQKWGVRRYQNYDGTYTQRGLKRYRESVDKYESIKAKHKAGTATRQDVKRAKRQMNKNYKKLKQDHLADQGKELYARGKTITSNQQKQHMVAQVGIMASSGVAQKILADLGKTELSMVAPTTIASGATMVNAILYAKGEYEAKRLRAYYAH